MPRHCGLCHHVKRSEFEQRALSGESIRLIAVDASLSESAISRHLRNHLTADLREKLRTGTVDLHVADFSKRLVDLVAETEIVRERAREANDGRLLLHAVASERDTLAVLMTKLGIDTEEVSELLAESHALAIACHALADYPDAAQAMANSLGDTEYGNLRDAFAWLADQGRLRLAAVSKSEELA